MKGPSKHEKKRQAELEQFMKLHNALIKLLLPSVYKEMPKPFIDPDEPPM